MFLPSGYFNETIIDNLYEDTGAKISVEGINYIKGNDAHPFFKWHYNIPIVSGIEGSQYFINKVRDRHNLFSASWKKYLGEVDGIVYTPKITDPFELNGYPMGVDQMWRENTVNIEHTFGEMGHKIPNKIRLSPSGSLVNENAWNTNAPIQFWGNDKYLNEYNYQTSGYMAIPSGLFRYGNPLRDVYEQYILLAPQTDNPKMAFMSLLQTNTVVRSRQTYISNLQEEFLPAGDCTVDYSSTLNPCTGAVGNLVLGTRNIRGNRVKADVIYDFGPDIQEAINISGIPISSGTYTHVTHSRSASHKVYNNTINLLPHWELGSDFETLANYKADIRTRHAHRIYCYIYPLFTVEGSGINTRSFRTFTGIKSDDGFDFSYGTKLINETVSSGFITFDSLDMAGFPSYIETFVGPGPSCGTISVSSVLDRTLPSGIKKHPQFDFYFSFTNSFQDLTDEAFGRTFTYLGSLDQISSGVEIYYPGPRISFPNETVTKSSGLSGEIIFSGVNLGLGNDIFQNLNDENRFMCLYMEPRPLDYSSAISNVDFSGYIYISGGIYNHYNVTDTVTLTQYECSGTSWAATPGAGFPSAGRGVFHGPCKQTYKYNPISNEEDGFSYNINLDKMRFKIDPSEQIYGSSGLPAVYKLT